MPTDVGSSKNGAFKYLKDRVWDKVKGWMEKILSSGGKEVLIKSIAQSIPTYIMSIFKLPLGLCDELNYTPSIPLCKVYYFRHGDQVIELSTS